jgi:hypothetical protein
MTGGDVAAPIATGVFAVLAGPFTILPLSPGRLFARQPLRVEELSWSQLSHVAPSHKGAK